MSEEKWLFNPRNGVRIKYSETAAKTGFYKVLVRRPDGQGLMEEPKSAPKKAAPKKKAQKKAE
jgi:hypothetical protein